jgi:hypothetical protein
MLDINRSASCSAVKVSVALKKYKDAANLLKQLGRKKRRAFLQNNISRADFKILNPA